MRKRRAQAAKLADAQPTSHGCTWRLPSTNMCRMTHSRKVNQIQPTITSSLDHCDADWHPRLIPRGLRPTGAHQLIRQSCPSHLSASGERLAVSQSDEVPRCGVRRCMRDLGTEHPEAASSRQPHQEVRCGATVGSIDCEAVCRSTVDRRTVQDLVLACDTKNTSRCNMQALSSACFHVLGWGFNVAFHLWLQLQWCFKLAAPPAPQGRLIRFLENWLPQRQAPRPRCCIQNLPA